MNHAEFEARVGTKIRGKWTLEKLLGVGGMAAVYLARHKIGRTEAIKLLHPEIAVDDTVRARFEQEAMAVNSIGHPGVVEIRDIDQTDDGIHFLVMELLDGETLADRFEREGQLRVPWLLNLVDQLLDVLIVCHRKSIIHRDIKPENLFIQTNGQLKVLDFGIARMRDGLRTQAGTMLGTVAFSPPEQLKGEEVDARADLFAVGATMFTVLAGRRVHETADPARLVLKMMREPAPPLHDVAPTLDNNLCMLVDRALAFLPERRYPDARTMRGDIWAVQKHQRPPYAYACEQSGLDPRVTIDTRPTKSDAPPSVEPDPPAALPTTAPQMPAFLDEPSSKRELPTTQPQMPAFLSSAPASGAPSPPSADPTSQQPDSISVEVASDPAPQDEQSTLHGIQPQKHLSTDPRWPARRRDQAVDSDDELDTDDEPDSDDELDIPISIELPEDD